MDETGGSARRAFNLGIFLAQKGDVESARVAFLNCMTHTPSGLRMRRSLSASCFGGADWSPAASDIAAVAEKAVEVIDGEMTKLGGEVTRRPAVEVMDELEAAEEAAEAAAREARRALREERKAELSASFEARVGTLKEKLNIS